MPGLWPTRTTFCDVVRGFVEQGDQLAGRGLVDPLLVDRLRPVRELVDGELPGLAGPGRGGAEGQVEGDAGVGQPAPGDGGVLAAPVGERPLVIGHLGPVGFRVPEEDDPAGFCDAHDIQLRMKQAMGRRELTGGSAGAAMGCSRRSTRHQLPRPLEEVGDHRVAGRGLGVRRVQDQCEQRDEGDRRQRQRPPRQPYVDGRLVAGRGRECVGADMVPPWVYEPSVARISRPHLEVTEPAALNPSGDPPT